jgi:hypothetical protein
MTPKVIVLGLIVLIGIGVAVGQQVRDRDGESAGGKVDGDAPVQNNPADRSVPQVQAWLKENVNLPGLRIIEWGDVERTETGYRVWVSYLGKNAVGGDAVVRRSIKFDPEGNITRVY